MKKSASLFHQFCQEGWVFERSMGNISGKLVWKTVSILRRQDRWQKMIKIWVCSKMVKLPKITRMVIPCIPFVPPVLLNHTNCSQNSWKSSFTEQGENRQSRETGVSVPQPLAPFTPKSINQKPSFPGFSTWTQLKRERALFSFCALTSPPVQVWPLPFCPQSPDCEWHTNRDVLKRTHVDMQLFSAFFYGKDTAKQID